MNKPVIAIIATATMAFAAVLDAEAYTYLTWNGTAESPTWDTTSENWLNGSTPTAFVNNSTFADFKAVGLKDVTVQDGGITTFGIEVSGGDHTLSGGPVTTSLIDLYASNLTIFNRMNCTDTTSGWGFRMIGNGTFTVGDGGYLDAYFSPADDAYAGKLVVLTGGTFRATFNTANLNNSNKPTIYFDGGTLLHTHASKTSLGNTKLVLGAGGMHIARRESGWTYLPGPIGTDADLPTDGGLITGALTDYLFIRNFANTYRGGLHIAGSGGAVGVESNQALGQAPASPEDNIFFESPSNTVASMLVSHGGVTLGATRNLRIGNGVTALVATYNSDSPLTIKGTFSCENPEHGHLRTTGYDSNPGRITLDPGANRTNVLSRLFAGAQTVIASGTTLLKGSTGSGYGDNSPLHIQNGRSLTVSDAELLATGSGIYATQSGTFVIDGGLVDLGSRELLHAFAKPATTTVRKGGRLNLGSIRMSGDGSGGDAAKSVVNVETGGVLRVTDKMYIFSSHTGYKATMNCNGGVLEWANTANAYCPYASNSGTVYVNSMSGIAWNVLEGGLVVSNDCNCYFTPALKSGAASDGGVTKWGSGTFALNNSGNDFNGPVTIMQGPFRLGNSNVIPATGTARVASGAGFYMNTYAQTLARIEGSGTFGEVVNNGTTLLTVTSAIAPGMGADSLGTLTVTGGAINIENGTSLEIDVDASGNNDCLSYPANLDLSRMTLHVNDSSKLAKANKYVIAMVGSGASISGSFASTNLPEGWEVKIAPGGKSLFLEYPSPFTLVVR